uniref:Uncharacterized protein n=1 Tax=Glossina pallidipes TaxID=7398 RepID=A0A1B0A814_GLOPL
MADKKIAEQYYAPPPKMGKWEGFKKFLWNSDTSQCLGRTGASWVVVNSYSIFKINIYKKFSVDRVLNTVFINNTCVDRKKIKKEEKNVTIGNLATINCLLIAQNQVYGVR